MRSKDVKQYKDQTKKTHWLEAHVVGVPAQVVGKRMVGTTHRTLSCGLVVVYANEKWGWFHGKKQVNLIRDKRRVQEITCMRCKKEAFRA